MHIWWNEWPESKSIIDKCPDMVRMPLNDSGDTALHVAVREGKGGIVNELVKRMRPEDMLIPNSSGDTPLHVAARGYSDDIVKELVNRMRPEDMLIPNSSGDTPLHLAVPYYYRSLKILNELVKRMRPEDMLIPLNDRGDTVLHVAVERGSLEIVKELVKRMRPEDMLIPNSDGMLPLHLAAASYERTVNRMRTEGILTPNSDGMLPVHLAAASYGDNQRMVNRMRPEDMLIPNSDGMLRVHLAAAEYDANRSMVDILSSRKVIDKMHYKDIERLFLMTIRINMFDLAIQLFEKHPTTLVTAKNEEDLTALNMMLAKELPEILDMEDKESDAGRLFTKILTQVDQLERNWIIKELGPDYDSPVLFHAVKSGCVEVVKMMIGMNRVFKDPKNGRNLLHLAVLFRQKIIFDDIRQGLGEHIVRALDNEGNNILHLAAHLPPVEFEDLSSFRASIQMQRELAWFKFVEWSVPGELKTMRNNMGKTPIDVFSEEHKKLSEEIRETAKGIAESGMLVSTLVATVAFAAALTVPGNKTNAWFTVFILTNALALFTSSASLLSFLSNFTSSRFAQSEFVISLHPSLTFGRSLLIISVAAMVVAFTAASFLIFDHTSKWVSYAVASMGLFPILMFLLFQFNLFDKHLWSRYYRLS